MEEEIKMNGKPVHIYGLKSIAICDTPHIIHHGEFDRFISKPIVTNRQGGIQFSKSFRIHESSLSPKLFRMLFDNKWNKPPKDVVCKFKLKNEQFARPVYQTFVFPEHSVDTKEKLRSITEFVRACYQL